MAINQFVEKLARGMVAEQGTAIIWRLHIDAATLYQNGNQAAAATFLEIADAAERELVSLRRRSGDLARRPSLTRFTDGRSAP